MRTVDDRTLAEVIRIRRHLHQYPELGHREANTAQYVEQTLRDLDCFEVFRPSATSVAALIGPLHGDIVVLRADMDALPLEETTGAAYSSTRPGISHACGHDGHIAALLATAGQLAQHQPFNRAVLLVFQQAEETHPSGAQQVLNGLKSRLGSALSRARFYGFHLWPDLLEHHVGLVAGPVMASVTGVSLRLKGSSGVSHGVHVHQDSRDALEGAVRLYDRLAPLRNGRTLTKHDHATLHLGWAAIGDRPQDVACMAELRGTLRAIDRESEAAAMKEICRISDALAQEHGLSGTVEFDEGIRPPLVNDQDCVSKLRIACELSGVQTQEGYPAEPLGVSEDFGRYLAAAPGAYFFLGCGIKNDPRQLHDPRFDFNEKVLCTATQILLELSRIG
jgi:amidohydrolase